MPAHIQSVIDTQIKSEFWFCKVAVAVPSDGAFIGVDGQLVVRIGS